MTIPPQKSTHIGVLPDRITFNSGVEMKPWERIGGALAAMVLTMNLVVPMGTAADTPQERMVKYILETARAFRTVYSKTIVEQADRVGVKPTENWATEAHGIMLPAQFVKAAGAEIRDFDLGLIGLTPVYTSNLPKTKAETEALQKMLANPEIKVLTFTDGNQVKGVAADYAIVQACVDCHNHHPGSPRRDFRQGDLMGAIVVRLNAK